MTLVVNDVYCMFDLVPRASDSTWHDLYHVSLVRLRLRSCEFRPLSLALFPYFPRELSAERDVAVPLFDSGIPRSQHPRMYRET